MATSSSPITIIIDDSQSSLSYLSQQSDIDYLMEINRSPSIIFVDPDSPPVTVDSVTATVAKSTSTSTSTAAAVIDLSSDADADANGESNPIQTRSRNRNSNRKPTAADRSTAKRSKLRSDSVSSDNTEIVDITIISSSTNTTTTTTASVLYNPEWSTINRTLYICTCASNSIPASASASAPARIAGFDLDHTLITTQSGRRFPISRTDWKWLYSSIPTKLQLLYSTGYRLVIFSNQSGISHDHSKGPIIKQKLLDIIKSSGVPIEVLISTAEDQYRKPSSSMFQYYINNYCNNNQQSIDLTNSFYVGDAAGRLEAWNGISSTKKDFSCSDRKFAHNCGIKFYTPEEYFLNHQPTVKFDWGDGIQFNSNNSTVTSNKHNNTSSSSSTTTSSTDSKQTKLSFTVISKSPAKVKTDSTAASTSANSTTSSNNMNSTNADNPTIPNSIPAIEPYHRQHQELVIFVAYPASGKSTFAAKYFSPFGYSIINQDTLKTKEKCVSQCANQLKSGNSVVIDNTNSNNTTRLLYISIAKSLNIPIRCFYFNVSELLAKQLNIYREKLTNGAKKHIPRIAYNMYKKNFIIPALTEGFKSIEIVEFIPHFNSKEEELLFNQKY